MACGCPVITSSVSSLPEVAGDAAVYIDPREPESLRSALERVIGDEDLRKKLKADGFTRAGTFSWEKTAVKTHAVYERIRVSV
jgi:glycosyltransferase involved in cell wall biosynthesis